MSSLDVKCLTCDSLSTICFNRDPVLRTWCGAWARRRRQTSSCSCARRSTSPPPCPTLPRATPSSRHSTPPPTSVRSMASSASGARACTRQRSSVFGVIVYRTFTALCIQNDQVFRIWNAFRTRSERVLTLSFYMHKAVRLGSFPMRSGHCLEDLVKDMRRCKSNRIVCWAC